MNKTMKKYEPELGQAMFGQPSKTYRASELLIAALEAIKAELDRVMWNNNQEAYESPFGNTGNKYKNKVFEAEAYSWDDTKEQKYNFRWKNFEVSWYKHLSRGTSINREIEPDEIELMLEECLESIRKEEKELY